MNSNITIVCYDIFSKKTAISNRMYAFAKFLKDEGYDLRLITSQRVVRDDVGFGQIYDGMMCPHDNKSALASRLLRELASGAGLFFHIFLRGKSTSVYLLSSPPFFGSVLASFALRMRGISYILDVRDLYPKVLFTSGAVKIGGIFEKIGKFLEKALYDHSISIITTTAAMKSHIESVSSVEVEIVHNGYDEDMSFDRDFQKATGLVFLGTLSKYTDIDRMIQTFRGLHQRDASLRFAIIGDGGGSKELEAIDFPCEIIRSMEHSDISRYLESYQIGVCFLKDDEATREILPVKIFEYLGLELIPVINIDGEASLLLQRDGLGVVCKDIDELWSLINDVAQQREILSNIKKNKAKFGRSAEASKLAKIFS